jgi:cell fate (sporulation/competence/biofilm development) regulator YlbF (YheA/YmcA/DUF963 family)
MNIDWKNTNREFCKQELLDELENVSEEQLQQVMMFMGGKSMNLDEMKDAIKNETEEGKKNIDMYVKVKKRIKKMKKFGIDPTKLI